MCDTPFYNLDLGGVPFLEYNSPCTCNVLDVSLAILIFRKRQPEIMRNEYIISITVTMHTIFYKYNNNNVST